MTWLDEHPEAVEAVDGAHTWATEDEYAQVVALMKGEVTRRG